ncbi:hypothetical protein IEQ44_02335 [Nocardioides sp. Y6]|uniref:Sulfotransferase family protein n=1 Tax=Nocardioides malaquae TaxID=2773426 RepID=A0ABR9RPK6_9ACTN|nr:hypothetical protein [Nocardioides malaquae]MBE7323491.1 hypothetical protein [Nocardioides malaquae]
MRARVVLHVGLMKSGTSFLQHTLFEHRSELGTHGIHVPGRSWRHQFNAALDVLRHGAHAPEWREVVDDVAAEGTSVISSEFLAPARREAVEAVVSSFPDHDVEVLLTVRDLNRNLPAMWQETVQNGRTWTWHDYLAGAYAQRPGAAEASQPHDAGRRFWRQQNALRVARRWSAAVGVDRVTVVTVPGPGAPRDELWRRVASVLGAPSRLSPPTPGRATTTTGANESVGLASALVLRQINEVMAERGLFLPGGQKQRKTYLAKRVMATRRGSEPTLGLEVQPWVREQAERQVHGLQALGVRLVGDWADLEPVPVPGVQPDDVDDAEVARAATLALADVITDLVQRDLRPYDDRPATAT